MSERTGALAVLAGQEDNKRSFYQFRPKLFPYLAGRGAYAKSHFRLWIFWGPQTHRSSKDHIEGTYLMLFPAIHLECNEIMRL